MDISAMSSGYQNLMDQDDDLPKRTSDGKGWIIAYDESNWEPIIVDELPSDMVPKTPQPWHIENSLKTDTYLDGGDCYVPISKDVSIPLPFYKLNETKPKDYVSCYGENTIWQGNTNSTLSSTDNKKIDEIKPGLVGLTNLGNTCFMNSGLQCIFNNPKLTDYFLENSNDEENLLQNLANNSLSSSFVSLLKLVWSSTRTEMSIKPSELKDILGNHHPQFQDYRQHDCQEFLALLLDTLHDQLNAAPQQNLFQGNITQTSRIECLKKIEVKEDNYMNDELDSASPNNGIVVTSHDSQDCTDICQHSETTSPKSTDSVCSSCSASSSADHSEIRTQPIPEGLPPFNIEDSVANQGIVTTNIIPYEYLTQGANASLRLSSSPSNGIIHVSPTKQPEKNQLLALKDNNISTSTSLNENALKPMLDVEDFVKDTKTWNTNMLVEEEHNNKISFDSSKFPRARDNLRNQEVVDNLRNPYGNLDSESNLETESLKICGKKRIKESNVINSKLTLVSCFSADGDLTSPGASKEKRMKVADLHMKESSEQMTQDEDESINDVLRCRELSSANAVQIIAEEEWKKYLSSNRSIIVNTFQGQFKSTVKCSACDHVSVTFEPFMYLPVPLPHALERQIVVTYISCSKFAYGFRPDGPVKYLINIHKHDKTNKIIEELKKMLREDGLITETKIILAEVKENYVFKVLNEHNYVTYVDDKYRSIFAFELPEIPELEGVESKLQQISAGDYYSGFQDDDDLSKMLVSSPEEKGTDLYNTLDDLPVQQSSEVPHNRINDNNNDEIINISSLFNEESQPSIGNRYGPFLPNKSNSFQCAICLEEKLSSELLIHPSCNCHLCPHCLEMTIKHHRDDGKTLNCPTCLLSITMDNFVPLDKKNEVHVPPRILDVPLLFRLNDSEWPGTDKLVSHPYVVQLPSVINAAKLYETVERFVPYPLPYSLHFVEKTGQSCSRCMFSSSCKGCEVARFAEVTLHVDESLAVKFDSTFASDVDMTSSSHLLSTDHKSMSEQRLVQDLSLNDCMKAFSESEVLDDNNPWFCPICQSNQRARKSLSIWRCPDTLMVYLKRFVFHEMTSIKVDDPVHFPISKLDMSEYVQGSGTPEENIYSLQACVCHSGGVNSGHYTAFAKHYGTEDWYYFNDDCVTQQEPTENDERAYILFYHREGRKYSPDLLESPAQENSLEALKPKLKMIRKKDSISEK